MIWLLVWGYALNAFDAPRAENCLLRIQHFPVTEIAIIGAVVMAQINFLLNRDANELQWVVTAVGVCWAKNWKVNWWSFDFLVLGLPFL